MQSSKIILSLFIIILSTFSLSAKTNPDVFVISKITNHVYIAHPGLVKRINSTSTIIVSKNYLTVIESQTDIFMATALIREIRQKISRLPIKYLIFSHFHTDHILGTQAFLQENPSLIIIAHQKAAEHILLHGMDEQKSWGAAMEQKSLEAGQKAISAKSTERKNYYSETAIELGEYSRDIKNSKIVPPNLSFNDSLTLYDEDLQVQLLFAGAAHTSSDIIAFIRQDKVLVTGDIVHDYEPLFWDADPDSWIQSLEKIKQIDFEYFVGGHGDMHKGKEIVNAWEDYIKELKAKTVVAIQEGRTLKEFQNSITPDSFISLQNGYGERIQKFRTSYMGYLTGPLLDAVRDEIAYIWKFYYAGNAGIK
jgi:glyoxylase-like metal-dependent hydrolase (beta-lactamase superfamily II)